MQEKVPLETEIPKVYAPENIRIARIMKRDNLTEEQIKARMRNQWDEEKKKALSDYMIVNDDSELLIPQVMKVYNEMKKSMNNLPKKN